MKPPEAPPNAFPSVDVINGTLPSTPHSAGVPLPPGPKKPVAWLSSTITNNIIFKGATIYGITGRKMFGTWERMSELLRAGLNIKPLVTHTIPFLKYEKAFELMESKGCGKVMLRV